MEMTLTQRLTEILEKFNDDSPDCMPCYRTDCDKCDDMNESLFVALTAILTAIRQDVEGLKWEKGTYAQIGIVETHNQAIDDVLAKLK